MNRISFAVMGLCSATLVLSCGKDGVPDPISAALDKIAAECGIACPGKPLDGATVKGVAQGNAAISGVPSVDAFFASVIRFQGSADSVSAGLEAQLDLIRADFGIDAKTDLKAGLKAQFDANLEGGVVFDFQPARCAVDAGATVQAQARCEAMVTPPKAMVECKGGCEVEAKADVKCAADVDLECSFTGPTVDCKGECTGSCEAKLEAAASCSGTCRGTCDGTCSVTSDAEGKQCAGSCTGKCMGTCEAKLEASAKCTGTCRGECKVTNPMGGCMGAAHAECKATAKASVMCEGKCTGEFTPPMITKPECQASAKAEAHLNVQCTPPRLALSYKLKAVAGAQVMAQAKFEGALKTLVNVRLPALLQASARADSIALAGDDLVDAAGSALKASFDTVAKADVSVKQKFGVKCALDQLPKVDDALSSSSERVTMNLMQVKDVKSACGLPM